MRTLQATSLLLGCGMLALLLSEREAAGRSKRAKKHAHSHGHSHEEEEEDEDEGHGHSHSHAHSHSPFTFGLGFTFSRSFGEEAAEEEEAEHSHALRGRDGYALHEGHSHEGGEAGEAGTATEFAISAGYALTKRLGTELEIGVSPDTGLADPTLGATYTFPLNKSTAVGTSLSATAPLSSESEKNYKIATISLSSGPTWSKGKFTVGVKAKLAKSYYSKTIIVEEEEDEDHDHALRGFALDEDHDHEEGEEHEVEIDEGTGAREFDRYGVNSNLGYRLRKNWSLGCGLGVAYVTYQLSESKIETSLIVTQATYTWKSFSGTLGLLTTGVGDSFTFPTTPGVTAGLMYNYE